MVYVGLGGLFKILPTGFLPDEDQGVFLSISRLPDGASIGRNLVAAKQVEDILQSTPGVNDSSIIGGGERTFPPLLNSAENEGRS